MAKVRKSGGGLLVILSFVACSLASSLGATEGRGANEDRPAYGPLPIEDLFSLSLGFLRPSPAAPTRLRDGAWELSVVESIGNDHAQSRSVEDLLDQRLDRQRLGVEDLRTLDAERGVFRVDLEHYTTTLGLARGVGDRSRVDLAIPIVDIEGGVLDRTIEGFHELLALGQAGRSGVERNDVAIYLRSGAGEYSLASETGKALGDVRLSFSHDLPLARPHRGRVAVRGIVKLPTGSVEALASSGSVDLGLQVIGSWTLGRSHLWANAGLTWLGEHELLGTGEQWIASGNVAWEYELETATSVVVQVALADSAFADLGLPELDEPVFEATIGVRRPFRAGQVFLGITENLSNFNNSSDIGVSFGLSRSFGRGFAPPIVE